MPSTSREIPVRSSSPRVLKRSEHSISRSRIDPDALKVLYRLHRSGHVACLVGGGVRDLLLGRSPKDFDLSTSAHPNEVRKLFGNCRLIGRRFRLAHVYFRGGKIIEVSTFRTISEFGDEEGPITSDNTFGTQEEDAFRRDFTVNALFYDIADFSVVDYVGGLEDLERGLIRCIGDPWVRFREDPIRMLRAIRFAGLLGFSLEEETAAAARSLRHEIWVGALPRIQEEILRMMLRGTAHPCFRQLVQNGFAEVLFPGMTDADSEDSLQYLLRLDQRYASGAEVPPWLALSCLLYPTLARAVAHNPSADLLSAAREVITSASQHLQIARRTQDTMRQVMAAQPRLFALGQPRLKPSTLLRKAYFRDALALFAILVEGDEEGRKLLDEWQRMAGQGPRPEARPPRRRRRRPRRRGNGTA